MPTSIFGVLCDICNEMDRATLDLEPGPVQERFTVLVARLDEAIDRTVGLEQATGHEEER